MSALILPWEVPGRTLGFDLSSAQQPSLALYQSIVAAGGEFVHVKAADWSRRRSEGYQDPAADAHLTFAAHAGIGWLGVYDFFHEDVDGLLQAESYARILENLQKRHKLNIRPCWDWEDGKTAQALGLQKSLDQSRLYLETIRRLTGQEPIVYTGPGMVTLFHGLDTSFLAAYDLWVAHYRWDPVTGHDYGVAFPNVPKPWTYARAWQCGGNGAPRIKPINGWVPVDLDIDVFFGPPRSDDPHAWTFAHYAAGTQPVDPGLQLGDTSGVTTIADEVHQLAADAEERSVMAALSDDSPDTQPGTPRTKSSQRMPAVVVPIRSGDSEPPEGAA